MFLMEYIRNNQAVLANILILSVSEKCLFACLVQVLFFIEHLATIKTRSTVLYESDNGVELDFFFSNQHICGYILGICWQLVSHDSLDKNGFK